jgi:hypothetical protein
MKDRWKTLREIAQGSVSRPSEVKPKFDRNLERILMTALAEEPSERFGTAGEFGKDILSFLKAKAAEAKQKE